ncbi:MAG: hypothetical protein JSU65_03460 [Candidatus Zixiibacteriota bacterium]|nr:MAG: hypothetical protein JSU65_03460 [candidate division Zixibacteria bacterium]
MLNPSEKAYYLALVALKRKDYCAAADQFDIAAPHFRGNREFDLFRETTRMLLAVKDELAAAEDADDRIEIEEVFSSGQETDIR